MKNTCFAFALKYEETFSPTQYINQIKTDYDPTRLLQR